MGFGGDVSGGDAFGQGVVAGGEEAVRGIAHGEQGELIDADMFLQFLHFGGHQVFDAEIPPDGADHAVEAGLDREVGGITLGEHGVAQRRGLGDGGGVGGEAGAGAGNDGLGFGVGGGFGGFERAAGLFDLDVGGGEGLGDAFGRLLELQVKRRDLGGAGGDQSGGGFAFGVVRGGRVVAGAGEVSQGAEHGDGEHADQGQRGGGSQADLAGDGQVTQQVHGPASSMHRQCRAKRLTAGEQAEE